MDQWKLTVQLNFTNPLYVSSDATDNLSINFTNTDYFSREDDNVPIQEGYYLEVIDVVPQAESTKAYENIARIVKSATESLTFTFIVPFGFMIFMSIGMNRVWGLYNFL